MKFMICRGKNYLVQTPLGLKIPNSPPPSYKKQEKPLLELSAEISLTKSSNTLTSHRSHTDLPSLTLPKEVSESPLFFDTLSCPCEATEGGKSNRRGAGQRKC